MNKNSSTFPWHYYIRTVRSRVILIVLTASLCFIASQLASDNLLRSMFAIVLSVTALSFVAAIFRIRPFIGLLGRIDKIQVKLPHNKKLDLIYQKDEWKIINEVLSLTEDYINQQDEHLLHQSIESNVLLDSIPNEIVMIDTFQNCKKYNNQFRNKFIKDRDTSVIKDEKLWKIFDDQEILTAFSQVVQSDQCIKLPAVQINGGSDYFDITITPIRDGSNKVIEALGIFHNVTNMKLTEKMRVDFVANVSHEIRTPLTSIKGYSQLLAAQTHNHPENCDIVIDKIVSNTERLKDLFENLLKLSVIESQYDVTKDDIDLDLFIKKIEAGLKGKYINKSFNLEKNLEVHTLKGDSKLLEQVITNLIDNAIKYTADSPKITLSVRKERNSTLIEIRDNGPGINENELNRIFERFYRVQGQSSKTIEGTGLGLSIVKHIINKHGGEIKVDSVVGSGTTFTISLPN